MGSRPAGCERMHAKRRAARVCCCASSDHARALQVRPLKTLCSLMHCDVKHSESTRPPPSWPGTTTLEHHRILRKTSACRALCSHPQVGLRLAAPCCPAPRRAHLARAPMSGLAAAQHSCAPLPRLRTPTSSPSASYEALQVFPARPVPVAPTTTTVRALPLVRSPVRFAWLCVRRESHTLLHALVYTHTIL